MERKTAYIYIAIAVVAVLVAAISIAKITQQQSRVGNTSVVAVINETDSKVLWIGGSALCIPAVPNSYLAVCRADGGSIYTCNGITVDQANITNIPC